MSEWWTYSLSSFLLFSPRTYYRLFELYNAAVWPAHIVAIGAGLAIVVLVYGGRGGAARAAAMLLAACWVWVGWAFLLQRYDTINWAARYFAAGFAIEALLLVWAALGHGRLAFRSRDAVARVGLGMLLFALFVQPLIAPLTGRSWAQVEIFGLVPDPTVVATLGFLLALERVHWELSIVPLAWCAISGATLWAMESPEAPMLPAIALLWLVLAGWKTFRQPPVHASQS